MLMQSAEHFNSLYTPATAQKQLIPVVPGWLQDGGGPPREIIQPPHTAIVAATSVRIKTDGEFVCCGTTKYLVRVLNHKHSL